MDQLTVMSFDMTHGLARDGTVSVERVARLVNDSGADLAGVQEIDRFWPRSYFENQAAVLGRLTGMHHLFAPVASFGLGRGLAILSRYPVLHHTAHRISVRQVDFVLQRAAVDWGGVRLTCLNTGPGSSREVWHKIQGICRDLHTPALLTVNVALGGFADTMRAIAWREAAEDTEPTRRPLRHGRPRGAVFFSPHWRIKTGRVYRAAWSFNWPVTATAGMEDPAGP